MYLFANKSAFQICLWYYSFTILTSAGFDGYVLMRVILAFTDRTKQSWTMTKNLSLCQKKKNLPPTPFF